MKAVILTGEAVQDEEYSNALSHLRGAGYEVDIATKDGKPCKGFYGVKIKANKAIIDIRPEDYLVMVIPGGVKCMEHLVLDSIAVSHVRTFAGSGGILAVICSGVFMLIEAGLCRGRTIACYKAWRSSLEAAGGVFCREHVSVEANLVTADHYDNTGPWMVAVLEAAKNARPWERFHEGV